jgi:hypothetical protein
MAGTKRALQQMMRRKYFHPTALKPMGADWRRIMVAGIIVRLYYVRVKVLG